jgi:hypothetical protein
MASTGIDLGPYGGFTYLNQDQLNNISEAEKIRIETENSLEADVFNLRGPGHNVPESFAFVGPMPQNSNAISEAREREISESRERDARSAREREAARERETAREREAAHEREARRVREREASNIRDMRERLLREREINELASQRRALSLASDRLRSDRRIYDMERDGRLRLLGYNLLPNYSDIYYKNKVEEKINDLIKRELNNTTREKTDDELMQLVKKLIKESEPNDGTSNSKYTKMKSNSATYPKFKDGDRFIDINNNKIGTVTRLRDDSYEQTLRKTDSSHYNYSVSYDDGTFETYLSQTYMEPYSSMNVNSNISKKKPSKKRSSKKKPSKKKASKKKASKKKSSKK